MYLLERQMALLETLKKENRFVKGSELSKILGVTDRTIRNDINTIKEILGADCIEAVRTKGYRYHPTPGNSGLMAYEPDVSNPEARVLCLLKALILEQGPVDIFDLANDLFVSERTIEADIQRARKILKQLAFDNIEIRRFDNFAQLTGVYNTASNLLYDVAKTFLSDLEYVDFQKYFTNIHLQYLGDCLIPILNENNYRSRYLSTTRFVLDVAMLIEAIYVYGYHLGDCYTELTQHIAPEEKDLKIAWDIRSVLKEKLNIVLNRNDTNYVAYILGIKRKMAEIEQKIQNENIQDDPFYGFFIDLIETLRNEKGITFIDNEELIKNLILHLQIAIKRTELGVKLYNPFIENFSREYLYFIDLAYLIAKKVEDAYGVTFDFNEISYIGIYLALALNNRCDRLTEETRLNLFIYVPDGAGILRIIQSQIEKSCAGKRVDIQSATTLGGSISEALLHADLVVTTSRRLSSDLKNVCLIKKSFDAHEKKRVSELIQTKIDKLEDMRLQQIFSEYVKPELFVQELDVPDKEAAIHTLSELLIENGYVDDAFEEYVLERESLATTDMHNGLALPHSIRKSANKTAMAVAILKKPVFWYHSKVKVVCMYAHAADNADINHLFTKCFMNAADDERFVEEVRKSRNYEEFRMVANKYFRP